MAHFEKLLFCSGGKHNNNKKFINKYFSVITKNLNWEILAENLVTFKRWDGL